MIARFGYFVGLTEEHKKTQEDNANQGSRQHSAASPASWPSSIWKAQTATGVSISIWGSRRALEEGGAKASATPLLPGQPGEDIPNANRVEFWEVLDHFVAPQAARL